MIVEGQKRYYGEALGIARFDQIHRHPAIPGDVENASTYPFPVRMKIIEGLYDNPYPPLIDDLGNYNPEVQKTIGAVKELAADKVRAIVCVPAGPQRGWRISTKWQRRFGAASRLSGTIRCLSYFVSLFHL
jgi:hypothetical protein